MERETYASDPSGGKILLVDVSDNSNNFKGNYWVQFAQSGREHDAYTVDQFDEKADAVEKAAEVEEVML